MPELSAELPTVAKETEGQAPLLKDLWSSQHISKLEDAVNKDGSKQNHLTLTQVSENEVSKTTAMPLPGNLDTSLKDLQQNLERTQKLIQDLRKNCDNGLYDLELSRRSLTGNPYKILTAGSSLALLSKSPALGSVPLAGFAAMQGYDDFKNLLNQDSFAGRSKYTLGLLADLSMGAGSLGFLSESIPMRYKLPMLVGGLAVRTAVDFIPEKKK